MRNTLVVIVSVAALFLPANLGIRAQDPRANASPRLETWLIVGQSNIEEGQVGFAFSSEMLANHRPTALLNATRGGTRIENWLRGGNCYTRYVAPYNSVPIDGILYWQGESDALNYDGGTWKTYGESFKKLIRQYREDFGNVPVIFVTLQRYDRNLKADAIAPAGAEFDENVEWKTCRQGQLDALALPNVHAVEIADITNGEVHPRYAYAEIGNRAARIALRLSK